ncbi:protein-export chaperone SecB [Pseudomonas helleri]|uniref:protein-export chaperone SecB n=1 Tax=Pseudomonas helleri TaxID=1608996 RepID=UPI003FD5C9BC
MKINIVENTVLDLVMKDLPAESESDFKQSDSLDKAKSKFSINVEFEEESFFVTFNLKLATADGKGIIVSFKSKFVTDMPIDEDFKKSAFPYVNAPAISYPYLRVFISNLTLNSGYDPVMLPSINFVALKDKTMRRNKSLES